MTYYVYMMTNKKRGTLYIGVTSDIERRAWEHKRGLVEGLTKRYGLDKLVYLEETNDVKAALQREKNLKHWLRAWKMELIESQNPHWEDLAAHRDGDPRVSAFGAPEDDTYGSRMNA